VFFVAVVVKGQHDDEVTCRSRRTARRIHCWLRRGPAAAQTVGQSQELLRSLDLTNELESGKGRPLRMRRITVQPGGALALHNHVDRPAITYLLQGEMTYYQEGNAPVVVRSGEGFAEGRATTHWAENTGKVPAVWIAVDIPKP
jgi:quercetin dioxygenase-like cupin family protein